MGLFLFYGLRNIWVRRRTTIASLAGIALVIFVLTAVLMLAAGIRETLAETGSPDNAIVVRKGATYETVSVITRDWSHIIATHPAVARDAGGEALTAPEVMVLINLPKKGEGQSSNATLRGVSASSLAIRPNIRLLAGQMFQSGTNEILVGSSVQKNFRGCQVGDVLTFSGASWRIVGIFEAEGSAFQSEIWGDSAVLMQAFRREAYSSLTLRMADPAAFDQLKAELEGDSRLQVDVWRERAFYASQSGSLASFIRILGSIVTFIFGIGAVVGAVITMYGTVSQRTREIGTLRALGFGRARILALFLLESSLIALGGALVGLLLASLLGQTRFSTTNFSTFSEVEFSFVLDAASAATSLLFALAMGVLGGFLPALRAARLGIVDALRNA